MYAAMGLPGLTEKPQRVLEPGDIVKIVGLKAAKEHNGKEGVLGEYVSHEDGDHAGRWRVTILGTETSLGVKRANLQFMRPKKLESIPNQGRGRTSSGAGAGRGPPAGQGLGSALEILQQPASWAIGLSIDKQYEWLCDCYRMRMDDLYCWGGGELRGIMACDASPHSLATEFLAFCKLAVMNKVVPLDLPTQPFAWNWGEFLDVSAGLVIYAFEKSDAQEKYGQENVFAAMMGGRSLRLTGEVVYGSSCQSGQVCGIEEGGCFSNVQHIGLNIDHELWSHREFDQEECPEEYRFQANRVNIFADVGGRDLWLKFHDRLEQNPGAGAQLAFRQQFPVRWLQVVENLCSTQGRRYSSWERKPHSRS